jgi:glucans biosynthesis protein C
VTTNEAFVKPERESSLDAARGILMMLGVFLHAANIYSTGGTWLIADSQKSPVFDSIGSLIHAFRMPAFFWISGYFCGMVSERHGSRSMLSERLPRLLIPLVVTWLLLNTLQEAFLAWANERNMVAALLDGVPLYHLWFLVDLVIFTLVGSVAFPMLKRITRRASYSRWLTIPVLMLCLPVASYVVNVAARATGLAYESPFGLTSLFRIANYLPFFLVGMLMYQSPQIKQVFLKIPASLALLAIPAAVYFGGHIHSPIEVIAESAMFLQLLMTWLAVAAVLNLFTAFFNQPSTATRFFSESAYSVYLFHHPFVVILGFGLLASSSGSWMKFILVCSGSLAIAISIHLFIIRKYWLSRLLFNGKK